ncbi:SPOR domain-containing protein [Novosphingobium soli]|uniref:SPOR domain-containing protein n=1 Tax=Novosphingobium soli TaxID=574956 RepID=A0ABV6CSX2_9SPHN
MRSPVNHALPAALPFALPLAAAFLLLGGAAQAGERGAVPPPANGPAADYPVVVGEPFTIEGTVWTPVDQLNYDAVGYAAVEEGAGEGAAVTAAHKTLPLPSYVEVTQLDTGRTILVRVERRGPMVNDRLVALSAGAAAQLGLAPGARSPVRVRRVNPPEAERALLRAGAPAPERMKTPEGLLKVLRRKLGDGSAPTLAPPMATVSSAEASAAAAPAQAAPAPAPAPPPPASGNTAEAVPARGAFVVQVAAFSSQASARKVAGELGGGVTPAGRYWRVRLGPFANRAKAAPALEKARAAGYSDARIQRAD